MDPDDVEGEVEGLERLRGSQKARLTLTPRWRLVVSILTGSQISVLIKSALGLHGKQCSDSDRSLKCFFLVS